MGVRLPLGAMTPLPDAPFRLPKLTITAVDDRGLLAAIQDVTSWVGEGHLVRLRLPSDELIRARFAQLKPDRTGAIIATEDPADKAKVAPGTQCEYIDNYWGDKAALVLNRALKWERLDQKPRTAYRNYKDARRETMPMGWNHEHCGICWKDLDPAKPAFKNQNDDWLCLDCHAAYVEPRSLSFIRP